MSLWPHTDPPCACGSFRQCFCEPEPEEDPDPCVKCGGFPCACDLDDAADVAAKFEGPGGQKVRISFEESDPEPSGVYVPVDVFKPITDEDTPF